MIFPPIVFAPDLRYRDLIFVSFALDGGYGSMGTSGGGYGGSDSMGSGYVSYGGGSGGGGSGNMAMGPSS